MFKGEARFMPHYEQPPLVTCPVGISSDSGVVGAFLHAHQHYGGSDVTHAYRLVTMTRQQGQLYQLKLMLRLTIWDGWGSC